MKWTNPKDGTCDYIIRGEYKYFITDTLGGYWYIARRKMIESNRRRFDTYKELYEALFGELLVILKNEPIETSAFWSIRSKTHFANAGRDSLRTIEADGRHYAVDLDTREFWEYTIAEKVSPDFRTVYELKKWADEFMKFDLELF